jgi:hypothetical protein
MSRYISDAIRGTVAQRAEHRCEYCRIPAKFAFFGFQIEHIVSVKHGGTSELANLANSCQICNQNKGSDIATFLENINTPIRFFNPRTDIWLHHFEAHESGGIFSDTEIGKATIKILDFNHPESIIERRDLMLKGLFF